LTVSGSAAALICGSATREIDMTDDITDWRELREFNAVDLTKSFVLSWDMEAESLLIDLDLYLCPEHAFYEKPRPAEKACFRPASLEFPYCSAISCDGGEAECQSVAGTAAALGLGALAGLRRIGDGCYEITGDFGQVEIRAERPILRLKSSII
jgi:hypothetical protein